MVYGNGWSEVFLSEVSQMDAPGFPFMGSVGFLVKERVLFLFRELFEAPDSEIKTSVREIDNKEVFKQISDNIV